MKKIMKTVQPSYLHLSNILSNRVEFSNQVIESSFSTRFKCLSSTSQFNSTLFQKNFNSTQHFLSQVLDSNSSTRLNAISLCSSCSRMIREIIQSRNDLTWFFYVYIMMIILLDKSFVLNSCNNQYSLLF